MQNAKKKLPTTPFQWTTPLHGNILQVIAMVWTTPLHGYILQVIAMVWTDLGRRLLFRNPMTAELLNNLGVRQQGVSELGPGIQLHGEGNAHVDEVCVHVFVKAVPKASLRACKTQQNKKHAVVARQMQSATSRRHLLHQVHSGIQ